MFVGHVRRVSSCSSAPRLPIVFLVKHTAKRGREREAVIAPPLRACRHCDCPAATGQDDPGRRRPSSVMSTKPLLRIEGIWLVVERHGSPSLFFRGRCYPHLILGFSILRPQAVVRHSKTPSRSERWLCSNDS